MGIRHVLSRKRGRFVTSERLRKNLGWQRSAAAELMSKLAARGVTSEDELRLEYFFYTNAPHKGSALAADLVRLGYEAGCRPSPPGGKRTVVSGRTTPMRMSQPVISGWTRHMCQLGFGFDCDFGGWSAAGDGDHVSARSPHEVA
jgi:hypothetical protein